MTYFLSGSFIEACDCTVICPCWVDDDPVGGHCTGLIAWTLDEGSYIEDADVAGCTVVSVSTHAGFRRDGDNATTVLYIDVPPDRTGSTLSAKLTALAEAFSGNCEGTLRELAKVSGTVASWEQARIGIEPGETGAKWSVTVRPLPSGLDQKDDLSDVLLVHADGQPQIFDPEHGNQAPLVLHDTALSHELGVPEDRKNVTAQRGGRLVVNVGALPGGSLEVFDRSGMRGFFEYQHPAAGSSRDASGTRLAATRTK